MLTFRAIFNQQLRQLTKIWRQMYPIATNVENKMQHFKSFGNIVAKNDPAPRPLWSFLGQRLCWNIAPVHRMAASALIRVMVHFKCEESDKGLSLQEMKCKFLRLLVMYICDVIR